ncbi:hypothetical protein A6R68_01299, partial [Neotoma lepida]
SSLQVKHNDYERAVLGRSVTIFCNLTSPANVEQITWQKIQDTLPQNIVLEPNVFSITIQAVTFEDEACYKCLFNTFPHGSHEGQTCLNILTVPELLIELQFIPGSEDLLILNCSAVGKPAPEISIYPSQDLVHLQEEYSTENLDATVTITKIYSISLKTMKSLGLQYLVVSMTHPQRNEEKRVPLPVNQEGTMDHFLNCMITAIVIIILFFTSCVISAVLCIYFRRK